METNYLILGEKIYEMSEYAYQRISTFDRNYRDTLGKAMKDCMNSMIANASRIEKKYYKKNTLQEIDIENDCLKKYVRMAKDLKLISVKQYGYWSKMCVEIGKIIGGIINNQSEVRKDREKIFLCSSCNAKISEKVYYYSKDHFDKALCLKCQKIEREKLNNK